MKTECRMQKAVVSDQWSVISNQAVHGSRITHHVSRITRPSSVAPRPSERGVALVITLVLLSVITFMAVTFLVVSRSQHGAVSIETDQQIARMAADTARERAIAELLAPIMTWNNEFNYGLLVSTNYINTVGYDQTLPLGTVYPLNVNYDYTIAGAPLTLNQQLQNLANLLYNPRAPVFITNSAYGSNEFRFFLNLNRNTDFAGNQRFDPTGLLPVIVQPNLPGPLYFYGPSGNLVPYSWPPPPSGIVSNFFVGDPQWIGGLQRPEFAHSATNLFTHRYAYLVVPAGQTLDFNTIHNFAKSGVTVPANNRPWPDAFLRNQGILTAEMNLAALLVDLNTNLWPLSSPSEFGFFPYAYNTGGSVPSTGAAADDAASLVRYRYATNLNSLASVQNLFVNGVNAFNAAPIDGYSEGPVMTGTWWTPPPNFNTQVRFPWAGSDNPNRFYTSQDMLDRSKLGLPSASGRAPFSFIDRLLMAGTNSDSYNRYTFYRMLSQVGTDTPPEPPGKMNLNYCNVDNYGNVVPNMATNFIPWQPTNFFINAAVRLLANAGYTVGPANSTTNLLVTNYVGNVLVTNLHIPLWPTNYYTPSVHRLMQLAANIYDATTNRTDLTVYPYLPTVFIPMFYSVPGGAGRGVVGQIAIVGYREATAADTSTLVSGSTVVLDLANVVSPPRQPPFMVSGIPLVIGAKKGFPNFNELAMRTSMQISRKLEFRRQGSSDTSDIFQTNQMCVVTISNVLGIQAWNSYSNMYPRDLSIHVVLANMNATLTEVRGGLSNLYYANFNTNQTIAANTWTGFIDANQAASTFRYPLWTNSLILTNSQYLQNAHPPQLVPLSGQVYTFERPSGFQSPDWWLAITIRLRFAIEDVKAGRIVDFVNLESVGAPVHVTGLMGGSGCSGANDYTFSPNLNDQWCTNTGSGVVPYGVRNQIGMGLGKQPLNTWSTDPNNWAACDFFRAQFPGLTAFHYPGKFTTTNTFYAPYVPTFATNFSVAWQANDPLVHYTIPDLTGGAISDPMASFGKGLLNDRYHPWGGGPNKTEPDMTKWNLAVKDPVIPVHSPYGSSDDWDFPAGKFPNVGWIGRVHRGTPWQTVYLKSPGIDVPTWKTWTGNGVVVTNFGQFSTNMVMPSTAVYYPVPTNAAITFSNGVAVYDAYLSQPPNDWHFLDLFTTALSDSATRGQLSINQTNLAAWSAALSGVCALTNSFDANGNPILASHFIEPAGVYDPFNTNTWTPIAQIVNNINNVRAAFPNGEFHTLGDVLAAPTLTVASPFLSPNSFPPADPGLLNLNDAAYERLPQQILGLLKCDHTPRFVIYAFGQTLKPESTRAIVKSGLFAGMCTNYQIVAEAATRTVVRFEGVPQFQPGSQTPAITSLHPVIESFTVLPPD
jgi:hypothetical protein